MSSVRAQLVSIWHKLPFGLCLSLQYFALTRVALTLFGMASERLIGHYDSPTKLVTAGSASPTGWPLLDAWFHWDSGWYLHIAQDGYNGIPKPTGEVDIAFFPLFPHIVRFLSWPFGHNTKAVVAIGLIVSSVGLIAAGYFLYRLAERKFGSAVARWAVIFLYFSPMAFVLSAFMSEGVFICLLAAGLLWADERRWRRVGLVALLLPLSRPVGVIAAGVLVLLYLRQYSWQLKALWQPQSLWLLAPAIGTLALLLINYLVVHNPFGFIQAESGWGRAFFQPEGPSGGLFTLQGLYLVAFAIAAIALATIYRKLIGLPYWLLSCTLIIVPIMTSLYGLARYTSIILPLYLILGVIAVRHPTWQTPMVALLALAQGVGLVWWSVGMPIMQ
jgi:hypothetical protein